MEKFEPCVHWSVISSYQDRSTVYGSHRRTYGTVFWQMRLRRGCRDKTPQATKKAMQAKTG